jgi:hypothetical protein
LGLGKLAFADNVKKNLNITLTASMPSGYYTRDSGWTYEYYDTYSWDSTAIWIPPVTYTPSEEEVGKLITVQDGYYKGGYTPDAT